MATATELDRNVESIYCDGLRETVVALNGSNRQIMTGMVIAIEVEPDEFASMPAECPLIIDHRSRHLGDFTVCVSCPNSDIQHVGDRTPPEL